MTGHRDTSASRAAARDPRGHTPEGREPVRVSPLAVPLFLGSLLVCALCSYLLGPIGLISLALVLVGALSLAIRLPQHRDAALGAVLGGVIGTGGVLLLALLYIIG